MEDGEEEGVDVEISVDLDEEGRIAGTTHPYRFSSWIESLDSKTLDVLRSDVEIVAQLPSRNYFIRADAEPAFGLEQLALAVFKAHAALGGSYTPSESGAEWWVQSRYTEDALASHEDSNESPSKMFHWDKDEALYDAGIYVCPQISTVTYLTDGGAPTVVLEKTPGVIYVEETINDAPIAKAFVSHPVCGKHIAFDGRYLHGILSVLRRTAGPRRRLTFLVNVWLNHQPSESKRFPLDAARGLNMSLFPSLRFGLTNTEDFSTPVRVTTQLELRSIEFEWSRINNVIPTVTLSVPQDLVYCPGKPATASSCSSVYLTFDGGLEAMVTNKQLESPSEERARERSSRSRSRSASRCERSP